MSEQNQQVQGGHLIRMAINDKVVGFGRSSTYNEDFGTQPIHVLGTIAPVEHVEMMWSCTISLDSFKLNASAVQDAAVELFEMVAQGHEEVKTQTKFDLTVLGQGERELCTLLQCTPAGFSMNFNANQFTGQNTTFHALSVRRGDTSTYSNVNSGLSAETTQV